MELKFKPGQKVSITFDDNPALRAKVIDFPAPGAVMIRVTEDNDLRATTGLPRIIYLRPE